MKTSTLERQLDAFLARRYNGTCGYGPWLRLDGELREYVATLIVDHDILPDLLVVGGQRWIWRQEEGVCDPGGGR